MKSWGDKEGNSIPYTCVPRPRTRTCSFTGSGSVLDLANPGKRRRGMLRTWRRVTWQYLCLLIAVRAAGQLAASRARELTRRRVRRQAAGLQHPGSASVCDASESAVPRQLIS